MTMNGSDDSQNLHQLHRPADVIEDIRHMDTRKRVNEILTSQAFKQELEQIVNESLVKEKSFESMAVLKEITKIILPLHGNLNDLGGGCGGIVPISDIRGVDVLNYSKDEKVERCKLATTSRLIDFWKWNENWTSDHMLSLRLNKESDRFLVPPISLLLSQITASCFLKIDRNGKVFDVGSTTLSYNQNMWSTYSAIYNARQDIKVILPLQSVNALAVSSLKQGLLLISKQACVLGEYSIFDALTIYNLTDQQNSQLIQSLGPSNKVLMIRNAGFLICGSSVEEATWLGNQVLAACETQISILPAGIFNLHLISEEQRDSMLQVSTEEGLKGVKEFEAFVRMLDNAGYRTDCSLEAINRQDSYKQNGLCQQTIGMHSEDNSPIHKQQELKKKQRRIEFLNMSNTSKNEAKEINIDIVEKHKIDKQKKNADDSSISRESIRPNQFTNMTEKDLKHYKQELDKKQDENKSPSSPTKSVSSNPTDHSREGSPSKEIDSKKKKKFRMPSFAKNKKERK